MKCKAECNNKKQCPYDAVLCGFCSIHFGISNIKKIKIYGQLKWEKRKLPKITENVSLNEEFVTDLTY